MDKRLWHSLDSTEVLKRLETDINQGLTANEIGRRLEKYGPNELTREEKISPWQLFFNQFKNLLIIILLIAIALSVFVGEVLDAAIIGVIVVFSAVLGFVQEYRAEQALESLKKMLSPTITVIRNGQEIEAPSKDLVPGDILLLEAGDKVPADARVVESHSLKSDEASLTGESVPVNKIIRALDPDLLLGDRKNMVFAGTIIAYGRGKAVVTETAMETEFGKIAREVTVAETHKTPLEKRTEEIGKWLGIISVGICLFVAGFSIFREALAGKLDLPFIMTTVMFAIALAVAAVPEALAAIVTGALAIGMHQMAKSNALVRKMPAVETLGCTTVICSDKTGTLTKGEMTVRQAYTDRHHFEVSGVGYEPKGELRNPRLPQPLEYPSLQKLLTAGLLCNDASLEQVDGKWRVKGDPTEGGLVVLAAKAGLDQGEVRNRLVRFREIPFSSERKRMTTFHRDPQGRIQVFMKGAPEEILNRSTATVSNGTMQELGDETRIEILKENEKMAKAALRVLGLAYKELPEIPEGVDEEVIEQDMVFLGLVGMIDPPREEAIEAVKTCQEIQVKTVMITGDHELTAVAIAREIGIYKQGDQVLTGAKLEKMSQEELEKIVDKVTVYARVSPLHKLNIVKAWKSRGEIVAMTGDGVNDAPALKHADIGIAMGITGTEVTKDAADMVLSDDNFATIVKAIERGRWIYDNIKKYLTYLLRCNITEVAVIGGIVLISGPEFLPLLPAAILYINLATDGLPALALGVAPPDPDIMQRPPRDPREGVFTWDVKAFILMALFIEIPFFYYLFYNELSDITHARTEIFFLFVIVELIIALNFRSMRFSIFKVPPHKWLIIAIVWEILLVAGLIQIGALRESFGIILPSVRDLTIILAFGTFIFISMEILKAVLRKKLSTIA